MCLDVSCGQKKIESFNLISKFSINIFTNVLHIHNIEHVQLMRNLGQW